jgi:hypothetical protein
VRIVCLVGVKANCEAVSDGKIKCFKLRLANNYFKAGFRNHWRKVPDLKRCIWRFNPDVLNLSGRIKTLTN